MYGSKDSVWSWMKTVLLCLNLVRLVQRGKNSQKPRFSSQYYNKKHPRLAIMDSSLHRSLAEWLKKNLIPQMISDTQKSLLQFGTVMFLSFGNGLTKYKTRWVEVNVLLVLCCVFFWGQFAGMLMQVPSEIQSLTFSTADRPTWSLADLFMILFCLCCTRVPLCVCCECSGADSWKTISAALNFTPSQSINQVIKFH